MKLVLDTIAYAERCLLTANPRFAAAPIFVHLVSDMAALDKVVAWGILGDRSSWNKQVTRRGGIFAELFAGQAVQEGQEGRATAHTTLSTGRSRPPLNSTGSGPAASRRSSMGGVRGGASPGRPGMKTVSVAAHRNSRMWPSSEENPSGEPGVHSVPVEAVLPEPRRGK